MKKYLLLAFSVFLYHNSALANNVTVANCAPPTASITLEINNVRARLLNGGDLWWGNNGYEIPKGSNLNSISAGAIWLSALDNAGNLHTAGQTYRQRGIDFWPGPLDTFGQTNALNCTTWDRFFSIKGDAIVNAKNGLGIDSSLLDWPNIAPFMDKNFDGIYDPYAGDYPVFDLNQPSNIPGEMIWWVMNDVGNTHTAYPGGLPLGIEIQTTAFAYPSVTSQTINNSTLYRYRIINKSSSPLYDVTVGQFMDSDFGGVEYVGCDISKPGGLFYCYNADPYDSKYGIHPPAVGLTYLKTFKNDIGDNLPVSSFMFFTNEGVAGINSDPANATELNRYLHAHWADDAILSYGTPNGRGGSIATAFAFPGDLYTNLSWRESYVPGDRRIVPAIGPFSFLPGQVNEEIFAVLWAQSDTGMNRGSVAKLKSSTDIIHAAAANNFSEFSTGFSNIKVFEFNIFPNPILEKCSIEIPSKNNEIIAVKIYELNGKLVYQNKFDPAKKIELNTDFLQKGAYIIHVKQGERRASQKILK